MDEDNTKLTSVDIQINSLRKQVEKIENDYAAVKQNRDDAIKNLSVDEQVSLARNPSFFKDIKKLIEENKKLLRWFDSQGD